VSSGRGVPCISSMRRVGAGNAIALAMVFQTVVMDGIAGERTRRVGWPMSSGFRPRGTR
jgi:hypothetical protein